jgi:hypothetical protein
MPMELRHRKGVTVRGGSSQYGSNNPESSPLVSSTTETMEGIKVSNGMDQDVVSTDQAPPVNKTTKSSASITMSKIRNTIFPIYGPEVKKFLLMGAIKFGVIMALTLTRDTKDTLVVTQCGAEAIAFLKVCISKHVRNCSSWLYFLVLTRTIYILSFVSFRFMEFYLRPLDLLRCTLKCLQF